MGIGTAPYGTSLHGWGAVGVGSAIPGAAPLRTSATGSQQTGRAIDPATRDFVMLDDGSLAGMPTVQQLVALAILGPQFRGRLRQIDRMGTAFAAQVRSAVDVALFGLVQRGLIEVVGVDAVKVTDRRGRVLVRWRDLQTGRVVPTEII